MYMYIGVCVYVCIYVCTCTYVPRYVCMLAVCVAASATVCLVCLTFLYGHHHKCCLRISAYNVCIYVVCMYRQISIHIYIYIYVHTCMYIYIIVYIYAVTYMHTYIHTTLTYTHARSTLSFGRLCRPGFAPDLEREPASSYYGEPRPRHQLRV